MHRIVAAFGGADRIGAAGIAFGRRHRIVAALAVGLADRVDRREIDHVKAHRGDVRQPRDAIPEGAVLAGRTGPGCVAPSRTRRRVRARGRSATNGNSCDRVRSGRDWLSAMASFSSSVKQRRGVAGLQKILALPQDHRGRGLSAGLCLGQQARAFDGIEGEIGAGLLLQLEAVPPGGEFVGPGLDGIDIAAGLVGHERAAPAVVAVMGHRRAAPFAVLLAPPDQRRGNHIMAIAIDIRPDLDALADNALHGKAAAVDQRKNIFDMESAPARRSRQFELFCSR